MLLLGGGSGVVPLMSMLRHRRLTMPDLWMRLVYSVRTPRGRDLRRGARRGDDAHLHQTGAARMERATPAGSTRRWSHRSPAADSNGLAFVCGTNGFVESAVERGDGRRLARRADPHRAFRPERLTAAPPPRGGGVGGPQ